MEWIEALTKLLGTIAWPITVLVIVAIFRKQISARLSAITEVKYPGGSLSMQAVEKLEAKIGCADETPNTGVAVERAITISAGDLRSALARVRVQLENELLVPSPVGLVPHSAGNTDVGRRINDLLTHRIVSSDLANSIISFLEMSAPDAIPVNIQEDAAARLLQIGAALSTFVRRERLVAELKHNLDKNLVWHVRPGDHGRLLSAVAACAPEFDYDYDIYRRAVISYNQEQLTVSEDGHEPRTIGLVPLDEYVEILKFRESEIKRVARAAQSLFDPERKAVEEWRWPEEWGQVGWNGPVARPPALWQFMDDDLRRLRQAILIYEKRDY